MTYQVLDTATHPEYPGVTALLIDCDFGQTEVYVADANPTEQLPTPLEALRWQRHLTEEQGE